MQAFYYFIYFTYKLTVKNCVTIPKIVNDKRLIANYLSWDVPNDFDLHTELAVHTSKLYSYRTEAGNLS